MLSDRIGRKPVLVLGYILFAVTAVCLLFTSQLSMLVLVFIVYGIFFGLIDGVQRAFVVDLAPSDLRGTALGTFHTATGLIALPAGIIAGTLWDAILSRSDVSIRSWVSHLSSLLLFPFENNKQYKEQNQRNFDSSQICF